MGRASGSSHESIHAPAAGLSRSAIAHVKDTPTPVSGHESFSVPVDRDDTARTHADGLVGSDDATTRDHAFAMDTKERPPGVAADGSRGSPASRDPHLEQYREASSFSVPHCVQNSDTISSRRRPPVGPRREHSAI